MSTKYLLAAFILSASTSVFAGTYDEQLQQTKKMYDSLPDDSPFKTRLRQRLDEMIGTGDILACDMALISGPSTIVSIENAQVTAKSATSHKTIGIKFNEEHDQIFITSSSGDFTIERDNFNDLNHLLAALRAVKHLPYSMDLFEIHNVGIQEVGRRIYRTSLDEAMPTQNEFDKMAEILQLSSREIFYTGTNPGDGNRHVGTNPLRMLDQAIFEFEHSNFPFKNRIQLTEAIISGISKADGSAFPEYAERLKKALASLKSGKLLVGPSVLEYHGLKR